MRPKPSPVGVTYQVEKCLAELEGGNKAARERAVAQLSALATKASNVQLIVDAGAVEPLVRAVAQEGSCRAAEGAVKVLSSLVFFDEGHSAAVFEAGGVEVCSINGTPPSSPVLTLRLLALQHLDSLTSILFASPPLSMPSTSFSL